MASKRHLFRRGAVSAGDGFCGFLCLAQENIEDWVGDAIATSTNRRLEGVVRRNWWGFTGRRGADAALHDRAGEFLVRACHEQTSELAFGRVLVTSAGPGLPQVGRLLHTAVPSHPAGRDPRPLPPHQAAEYMEAEEAEEFLAQSFSALLSTATELDIKSLCCPAIGCGCRGFPLDVAARIGLDALAGDHQIPYVEVRFWDHSTFMTWLEASRALPSLAPCEDSHVREALWDGLSLSTWSEQRRRREAAGASGCTLM
eukprot:TRINITY_DN74242_c0_g1_i1.p1 TRINITY_DN74242_c0_g1~~TRINITY_DN74242_c0_g1_i1.p1  ORF type:complete len:267 (-),score=30.43 TRINITY_DN74242_c0_g1_i1:45-815(-)